MNDVVLYLNATTRAVVAISVPGIPLPSSVDLTNTVQMQVNHETWQRLQSAYQALPANQDLVVNADGTTGSVAHTANPREQGYQILVNYLANTSPTGAETVQALKTVIRIIRAISA